MATLVGWYPTSIPPKCRSSNLRKLLPLRLVHGGESASRTPLPCIPPGADRLSARKPGPSPPPTPRRPSRGSSRSPCSRAAAGRSGDSFARSLPAIESGSTEMEPPSDSFPFPFVRRGEGKRPFPVFLRREVFRPQPHAVEGELDGRVRRAVLEPDVVAVDGRLLQRDEPGLFLRGLSGGLLRALPARSSRHRRPPPLPGTRRETFILPSAPLRIAIRPLPVAISPTAISFRSGSICASFTENAGISRKSSFSSLCRSRRSLTEAASPSRRNRLPFGGLRERVSRLEVERAPDHVEENPVPVVGRVFAERQLADREGPFRTRPGRATSSPSARRIPRPRSTGPATRPPSFLFRCSRRPHRSGCPPGRSGIGPTGTHP